MPRIVLVDDDRSHMMSLSMMLEAEGFEVECHSNGLAAWESLSKSLPDILVLDVKLPGLDGMDVVQRLRHVSNIPVMFCTTKEDEIDEVLGLRMGADDYVKKPSSPRVLLERIRALLRRWDVLGGDQALEADETTIMVRGPLSMDPMRHGVTWRGMAVALTVTEFALLKTLTVRPGFVKSRDQLMDVAYDDQVYVDERTIDSHIKRLRKKMRRVDGDFDAIETLYGIGYRYNEA
ncbi:response regulator transcription factor [Planktomarina temperata]|nr:response regulator transcription factor [Planktomarina temperata]